MRDTTGRSPKIFCIGLSKTGTTSLAQALEILGYRTKDNLGVECYARGDLSCVDVRVIDKNDAFTDTPIPSYYQELDARYPGSKFILTVRDMESWLRSCKKQFNRHHTAKQNEAGTALFMDLYGCATFEAKKFQAGYERFFDDARAYFAERPESLLVLDVCAGEGWEKLCAFLGKPVPEIPFPFSNVTEIQWMDIGDIVAVAREAGREIVRQHGAGRGGRFSTRTLLRAVGAAPGGGSGGRRRMRKAAQRVLVNGLRRLNASVPVLSRENEVRYEKRKGWPHFWLVEPLGIGDDSADNLDRLCVSIALIQGRKPLFGVVHFPFRDLVYHAKGNRGSFRVEGSGKPEKLGDPATDDSRTERVAAVPALEGPAPALCALAEGAAAEVRGPTAAREWEVAAAHAIVKFAGRGVYDADSMEELTYNTEDLTSKPFVAR